MIRDNGGWDNFRMIEVEKYPCSDKREAEKRENEIMKELKASMNMQQSYVSEEEKKEKHKIYIKEYYGLNKNILAKKQKEYDKTRIEFIKTYKKEYHEINKDKDNIYKKEWYEKNKERIKAERKERYKNNKQEILEKQKIYNENNKEMIKERKHRCYLKNKDKNKSSIEDKLLSL